MKLIIIIIIVHFLLIFTLISAQEFEINKLDEMVYAQTMSGNESVQIINDNLFYLTLNGLEIYEIYGDGSISKISSLAISASLNMIIKDQYCFVISGYYSNNSIIPGYFIIIYKVDISDLNNPTIVDQLEYTELYDSGSILSFGDNMIMKWLDSEGFHYDFYSLPELGYVGQVISDNHHQVVDDSLLIRQDSLVFYVEIYTPPNEFETIGELDVSGYSDGNYAYEHFKVINDTILTAVNPRNITFWDISDATNLQYLSRYTLPEGVYMAGNMQYSILDDTAIIFYSGSLQLIDFSDIYNPVLVDTSIGNGFSGLACDSHENNLYVSFTNFGIQHYEIENNSIVHLESYYDYERFTIGTIHNNKLIARKTRIGYYLFDIEDPLNHIELGEWFDNKKFRFIHKQGCWMLLKNYENLSNEIYDVIDLENPILRNTITLDNQSDFAWTNCFIDEYDPNSIYLCNYLTKILKKYDISEPGEVVELFEYELPSTLNLSSIAVINSIAYITYGEDYYDLLVIDGLEQNVPFIANDINNFTQCKGLKGQEGYLTTRGTIYYTGQIFSLDDPLNPELYFEPIWGTDIEIHDDLIFAKIYHIIGVYENRPNCTEPIAIFNGLNYIYNINLIEHEGINYLITNEMANIGLFEYTYVPSSAEDELPKPEITLSNYPNPFNPSTTISFSVTQNSDFVTLEIFNIKGQKVKQLEIRNLELGINNIIWNGTDDNDQPVSSGVYFYKLITPTQTLSKKMLLLK
ncbi:MAG: T9SS type A sorting domain-containing protein [Candidatus Cloacimonadota bacterium]|nr:T9SS type A sorting domain-containing protein [Candidatus Cloacimonadota bacterium]